MEFTKNPRKSLKIIKSSIQKCCEAVFVLKKNEETPTTLQLLHVVHRKSKEMQLQSAIQVTNAKIAALWNISARRFAFAWFAHLDEDCRWLKWNEVRNLWKLWKKWQKLRLDLDLIGIVRVMKCFERNYWNQFFWIDQRRKLMVSSLMML